MTFYHTHTHTEYSVLDGMSRVDDLVLAAKKDNQKAIALTEHGKMASVPELLSACKEHDIRPIIGQEFYITPEAKYKDKTYHITILALNDDGYNTLCELSTVASEGDNFYRYPRINHDMLRSVVTDNLVAYSGCMNGEIPQAILNGNIDQAKELLKIYRNIFPNFFFEFMAHGIENSKDKDERKFYKSEQKINKTLWKWVNKYNIPAVITNDSHYTKKNQARPHEILLSVQTGTQIDNPSRFKFAGTGYHFKTQKEMRRIFPEQIWKESTKSLNWIYENSNIKLKEFTDNKFYIPDAGYKDPLKKVRQICIKNMKQRVKEEDWGKYKKQLEYELDVVDKAGFANEFLIVQDYVIWAKENGLTVGSGRGCFLPGNKVKVNGRFNKNIENIKIGDTVLTNDASYQKVKNLFEYDINEKVIQLDLNNDKQITCTLDHKILTQNGWKQAQNLTKKDILLSPIGDTKRHKVNVNCSSCGEKYLTSYQRYFEKNKTRCRKCCDIENGIDHRGKNNPMYGHVYTNKEKKKISHGVRKAFKNGLGLRISDGLKRAYQEGRRDSKVQINNIFEAIKDNPSILDRMGNNSFKGRNHEYIQTEKAGEIYCQSSLEKKFAIICDTSPDIIKFRRYNGLIRYTNQEGKRRYYKPDFVVNHKDLGNLIVEVKSQYWLDKHWDDNQDKFNAVCNLVEKSNKYDDFVLLVDDDVKQFNDYLHKEVKITKIQKYSYKGKVYDIQVEKARNYTVGGVTVHNSMVGVLISYLMRITDVDPLRFDLSFENALNPARPSLPDFDIDFDNKDAVIEYIKQKYGEENVMKIGTFNRMNPRSTLGSILRSKGYSAQQSIRYTKQLPDTFDIVGAKVPSDLKDMLFDISPEITDLFDRDKEIYQLMFEYDKLVKTMGSHAGGIIISDGTQNLRKIIPGIKVRDDTELVSQFDKKDVEKIGFIKFDILGITTLKLIKNTLELMGKDIFKGFPDGDNLDDEGVFNLINNGLLSFIFQLDGVSNRSIINQIGGVKNFEDIVAVTSLSRPGSSKFVPDFVKNRKKKKIKYIVPQLSPILDRSNGVILYIEQVMQIVQDIAGFDMIQVDDVRRLIKGKDRKKYQETEPVFIKGCIKNGIVKKDAKKLWELIESSGGYLFNRAHAVSYCVISYMTAYLKAHYPIEFFTAAMNIANDKQKINLYQDAEQLGIKFLRPSVRKSEEYCTVEENGIRIGLSLIKGIGIKTATSFVAARNIHGLKGAMDILPKRVIGLVMQKALRESGAYGNKYTNYQLQKDRLGFSVMLGINKKQSEILNTFINDDGRVGGRVDSIRYIKTKNGDDMAFLNLNYKGKKSEVVFFPNMLSELDGIREGNIVLVKGQKQKNYDSVVPYAIKMVN